MEPKAPQSLTGPVGFYPKLSSSTTDALVLVLFRKGQRNFAASEQARFANIAKLVYGIYDVLDDDFWQRICLSWKIRSLEVNNEKNRLV